jgi:threonine dehydratase
VPGVLAAVSACVARENANIAEVYHQRAFSTLAVQNAELNLVLKTRNREHVRQIVAALQREGFTARAVDVVPDVAPATMVREPITKESR